MGGKGYTGLASSQALPLPRVGGKGYTGLASSQALPLPRVGGKGYTGLASFPDSFLIEKEPGNEARAEYKYMNKTLHCQGMVCGWMKDAA